MSHVQTICDCTKSQVGRGVGDCRMSHKSDREMLQKEVKVDCDCKISQLVVKVFTKLLWILDCDSKCQEYSRTSYPRRFGKRKRGGAESRKRRNARRAETAPPDPPPRSTSLICGMTPEVPPKDEMIRAETETETETETEIKKLQSKIDKELRSLSEINKEIDNRVLQLKLPPKLLPPKLPPKMLPKQDLHFVTMNPGKATEINTLDPSQANERKATLTTVKQTTVQPREKESRMINKAKEFLKKASKEKDKEAEKKLEKENRCAMCKKLHKCSK